MRIFLVFILSIILLSCKSDVQKPDNKQEIYSIQTIGELATAEYTYGKILELNDEADWYKVGNRRILINVRAKVKAGVDLTKLSKNDIKLIDENSVRITLPEPEILSFDLNQTDVNTVIQDVSGFRFDFSQEEKLKILKLGEQEIRKQMLESTILIDARINARVFVEDFYTENGFKSVEVSFKKSSDEQ